MKRNCNLELNLFPLSDPDHHHLRPPPLSHTSKQQKQQPLTIIYNGSICVSDVTEPQAKAILMLASREKDEERMRSRTASGSSSSSEPASPTTLPSPIQSPYNGLSMKRSLQRFLQKRNHRIQSTYPYNVNRSTCTLNL